MEIVQRTNLKDIVNESLKKSISYRDYRALVSELVEINSTTGNETTEALINYTLLNDRRMKRWDKTVKVPVDIVDKVKHYAKNVTWLVLTESWCGDAAHLIPVMNKIADLNKNIDFKVVLRDENEDLMNAFLTHGSKSIPKLIMIDNETKEVIDSYGPRPSSATTMVTAFKEKYGVLTPEFKEDLQRWYNKDKGQTAIQDLVELIA